MLLLLLVINNSPPTGPPPMELVGEMVSLLSMLKFCPIGVVNLDMFCESSFEEMDDLLVRLFKMRGWGIGTLRSLAQGEFGTTVSAAAVVVAGAAGVVVVAVVV